MFVLQLGIQVGITCSAGPSLQVLFVCFLNLFRAEAVVFLCIYWPHTGKCGGGEHAIGSRALQRGSTPGGGN